MSLSVLIPWDPRTTCPYRWRSFDWLLHRYNATFPDYEVCVGTDDSEPFNRSRARNNARALATGDVLLIADADTLFDSDQVALALGACTAPSGYSASWVLPYKTYYNLDVGVSDYILRQNPEEHSDYWYLLPPTTWEHKIEDSPAGLLVMPAQAFDLVGGYDERFVGWGYEDNAFRLALETLVGAPARLPRFNCYHLWHPVAPDGGFESPTIKQNRRLFRRYERAAKSPAAMKALVSESIHHRKGDFS